MTTASDNTKKNTTTNIPKRNTRHVSGFTLIELLIVICIIGILATFSTPVLSNMLFEQRYNNAVRDVLATLRQARLTAVEKNETVVVSFDTATGSFQAFLDDGGGDPTDSDLNGVPDNAQNWAKDPNERVIIDGTVPDDVTITAVNFTGNSAFRFNSRGFPISMGNVLTNGTITMSSTVGIPRQIDLFRSGHSRIQ